MNFGPLQQVTFVDELLEAGGTDEVVVDTVDFTRPRRPRRGRDTEMKVRKSLTQTPNHRRLTDRGGTGQHDDMPWACWPGTRSVRDVRSPAGAHCCSLAGTATGHPACIVAGLG